MENSLDTYRKELDSIDEKLVSLFCERMEVSEKIGAYKKENNLPVTDANRENEVIEHILAKVPVGRQSDVAELYKTVFSISKKAQESDLSFRLAVREDITMIKIMFSKIVIEMMGTGLNIWDNIYPNCAVEEDIESGNLYVLEKNSEIIAAFSLLDSFSESAENSVKWPCEEKDMMYMFRLGVNPAVKRRGYATLMLEYSKYICKAKGKKYIALYAAETNKPAINFYTKNGFMKMDGIRNEKITDDYSLTELGYCLEV